MANKRKNAFLGLGEALLVSSLIGAGSQVAGSLINKKATEKANQNAIDQQNTANLRQQITNQENELNNSVYKDRIESKLNVFSCGGRKRKVSGGKVTDNDLLRFIIGRKQYNSKLKHKI